MSTVSVIIPTFNSQDTLAECLESVIGQEFKDLEICIVDGNSSDGTVGIIREYGKRYGFIKYLSEKDRGPYEAMNKGIDMASGDWLYFLGSNDLLHNQEVFKEVFGKPVPEAVGLMYGNVRVMNDAGFARRGEIYDGAFTLEKLLERNICHQAVFYRRSLMGKLGKYNLRYPVCADWDMNVRFFSHTRAVHLDLTVAVFRGGGLSSRQDIWDPLHKDLFYRRKVYRAAGAVKRMFRSLVPHGG
jgi:glycosyltransferase involved in cell wall biosynthesis